MLFCYRPFIYFYCCSGSGSAVLNAVSHKPKSNWIRVLEQILCRQYLVLITLYQPVNYNIALFFSAYHRLTTHLLKWRVPHIFLHHKINLHIYIYWEQLLEDWFFFSLWWLSADFLHYQEADIYVFCKKKKMQSVSFLPDLA